MNKTIKSMMISGSLLFTPLISWAADFEFTFQTAYTLEETAYFDQKAWADALEKETDGRLKINLIPDGGIVGYNKTLDAMRLGLLDGHISLCSFFADKEPAFSLLTNAVAAWDSGEQASSFMRAEGNEVLRKVLQKYNVHLITTFNQNIESFVSKKPTKRPEDLKGMKLRVVDAMTTGLFSDYGIVAVPIGFGQVVDGLKQNVLDGGDLTTLTDNQAQGANDAAPNPIFPGFHVPILDISISQEKWDTLPADLQAIVTASAERFSSQTLAISVNRDNKTLQELNNNSDITVNDWSAAEHEKLRKKAVAEWKKVADKSPLATEAYNKLINFLNL